MNPTMSGDIERILSSAGLDPDGARIEPMVGGISSETFSVQLSSGAYVVKRSLAKLNVVEDWHADPRRVVAEGHALEWFHSLTPALVPKPLAIVEDYWALVLPMAPAPSPDLRRVLLDFPENFNPEHARVLGETLALWHSADPSPMQGSDLDDVVRLTDLRIDPFYRGMAERWPEHSTTIKALVDELTNEKLAVVHGDFTPKNVLCLPGGSLWVIDTEVAHIGNPVLDTAPMMAHLILKTMVHSHQDEIRTRIQQAQSDFLGQLPEVSRPPSLGAHTGLFMAVRVAGRAQVPYLSEEQKQTAENVARALLNGAPLEEAVSA